MGHETVLATTDQVVAFTVKASSADDAVASGSGRWRNAYLQRAVRAADIVAAGHAEGA